MHKTSFPLLILISSMFGCDNTENPQNITKDRIDVGGHKLYIESQGKGDPVVVLESGIGDAGTLAGWQKVVTSIKENTRICLYDRAGLGNSEPGPQPRSIKNTVDDLHTLLHNARLNPPYILVGHSMGGLNVQLFAQLYPSEVAGIVLVDPSPKEFVEKISPEKLDTLKKMGVPQGAIDEIGMGIDSSITDIKKLGPLPDVPVVVLTSSLAFAEKAGGIGSEKWNLLRDCHQALIDSLSSGSHVIASKAGHYIQTDEPGLVIDAIRKVLETRSR